MAEVTKTVNPAGGADYLDLIAWNADLDDGTKYTAGDVARALITGNAVFAARALIDKGVTLGLAGRIITVDPAVRHNGQPGTGARFVVTASPNSAQAPLQIAGQVPTRVEFLEVSGGGAAWGFGLIFDSTTANTAHLHAAYGNLVHDIGMTTAAGTNVAGISFANTIIECCNNKVYRIRNNTGGSSGPTGINIGNAATISAIVENNTVHQIIGDTGTGPRRGIQFAQNNASKQLRNNVVGTLGGTGSGANQWYNNVTSATAEYNASAGTDAPGPNSIQSIDVATTFVDATSPVPDLQLVSTSPLFQGGKNLGSTPAGVNVDVASYDRVAHSSIWSIGAHQEAVGSVNDIAFTFPDPLMIFGLDASDEATGVFEGLYTGAPTGFEISIDDGPWVDSGITPSGGTFSFTRTLAGKSTGYKVAIRFTNDPTTTDVVQPVYAGYWTEWIGQSNMAGRGLTLQTPTPGAPLVMVTMSSATPVALADPTSSLTSGAGSYALLCANQLWALTNRPIGVLNAAEGGTSYTQWQPGTGDKWNTWQTRRTLARIDRTFIVAMQLGENDATASTPRSTLAALQVNIQNGVAALTGAPGFVVVQLGSCNSAPNAASIDAVRFGQVDAAAGDPATQIVSVYAVESDGLHYRTNGALAAICGFVTLAARQLEWGGASARGPVLSTAIMNTARTVCDLFFTRPIADGLTFALAAWAFKDNGAAKTITTVDYHPTDPNGIRITLSSALTGPPGTGAVTLGTGNTANNLIVPTAEPEALPGGGTSALLAEPFTDFAVNEAPTPGSGGARVTWW